MKFESLKKQNTHNATETEINAITFSVLMLFVQKTDKQMEQNTLQFDPKTTIDKLNFYCFSDSNVDDPEDLNFKNLKKCQKTDYLNLVKNNQKFLLVDFDNIVENKPTGIYKKNQYWNNQDMQFVMQLHGSSSSFTFTATIKSILHKGFSLPTTNT